MDKHRGTELVQYELEIIFKKSRSSSFDTTSAVFGAKNIMSESLETSLHLPRWIYIKQTYSTFEVP